MAARELGGALWLCGITLLCSGGREQAEALWREMAELAAHTRDEFYGVWVREIWRATLGGRLEAASSLGPSVLARADASGMLVQGRLYASLAMYRPLILLGRGEEALAALPEPDQMAGVGEHFLVAPLRALCLAHLGRRAAAQEALSALFIDRGIVGGEEDALTVLLTVLLETAVLVEDRRVAAPLATLLAPAAQVAGTNAALTPTCVSRHLAAASALLGEREAALGYYLRALDLADKMGHRPEIGLTRLGIAELLLDEDAGDSTAAREGPHPRPLPQGEGTRRSLRVRTEALAQLDFAIAEFRDMKMQTALERALRHKEVLRA